MHKRKSQMEIMGLAIIILLLTLAMIFVVRFVILKGPSDIKKGFTQTELASNMVNTFLKSTSRNCRGRSDHRYSARIPDPPEYPPSTA